MQAVVEKGSEHLGERDARRAMLLALALALVPYLFVTPHLLREYPYSVQDDARHVVVWLRQFRDTGLFANDFIADHLNSMTPWLYSLLYQPLTLLGVDPVLQYSIVFAPLSGLLLVGVAFRFIYRFWPSPTGAALAALVMMMLFGVPDGMAHAFGFSMVLLALLAFLKRRVMGVAVSMMAAAGLLPVSAITAGGTMALLMLCRTAPFITRDKRAWLTFAGATAGALIGAAVLMNRAGEILGGTMTLAEARGIPFFGPDGRRPFFGDTWASTYLCNQRAGITPFCTGGSDAIIVLWSVAVATLLAFCWWIIHTGRLKSWLEEQRLQAISDQLAAVLAALVMAGGVLFPAAHLVAFRLHNPERFARYTIGLVTVLLISILLAALSLRIWSIVSSGRRLAPAAGAAAFILVFVGWSALQPGRVSVVRTSAPEIYDFLRESAPDALVASLLEEADNVPAFSSRRTFVSMELLTSRERGYFAEMRERLVALSHALYAADGRLLGDLSEKYGIDFYLLERDPDVAVRVVSILARSFPELQAVLEGLSRGEKPGVRRLIDQCKSVETEWLVLLDAACLTRATHATARTKLSERPLGAAGVD